MKEVGKSRLRNINTDKSHEVLANSGRVPMVPSPRDTWCDKTICNDFFWRDVKKRNTCAYAPSDGELRFIQQESRVEDRNNIDENSMLRFRNERKELPLSEVQFSYPKQMMLGWQSWVDYIVDNPDYKDALENAGIRHSLWIFSRMNFRLSANETWRAVISRWSTHTHTFVTAWGEITPTLEDVCTLFAFPDSGLTDITTTEISKTDKEVIELLIADSKEAKNSRGHASFFAWMRHFFEHEKTKVEGPRFGCQYELEAFLACWLSFYVFPGGPEKGISPRFFHLAVRLARGERFALAPFYLGSLYWRLDLFIETSVRSKGRYAIISNVDLGFLHLFFCEHYKRYVGGPVRKPDSLQPRAWAWGGRKPLGKLLDIIDDGNEIDFRPYTKRIDGYVYCPEDYPSGSEGLVNLIENGEQLSDAEAVYISWCTPRGLPGLHDWGNSSDSSRWFLACRVMVYSPHRVARQFGFDQGVPSTIAIDTDFDACCEALSLERRNELYTAVRQMFFPSIDRVGVASAGWLTYWTKCLEDFKKYVSATTYDNLPESTIYKYEFHFRLLKDDKSNAPLKMTSARIRPPIPPVRQIKRPRIHERVTKKITFVIPAEPTTRNKHSSSAPSVVPLEGNSMSMFAPPITQPFPNRYGCGKVLRIEDCPVIPATAIEEEEDVEQLDDKSNLDFDTNARVNHEENIDDEIEICEITPIDEMDFANRVVDTGHDEMQDVEELDKMSEDDDHESMHLGENQIPTTDVTNVFPLPVIEVAENEGVQKLAENTTTINTTRTKVSSSIASFHGHSVPSHLLPSLEHLHAMEGDFWTGSICLGTDVTTDIMTLLGRAAELLDKPWHTLDMSELELLVSSVTAASAFRFKISKMERIAAEAQKILDCKDLMMRYDQLMAELAEVKHALKECLGDRDVRSTVRSIIDT